jgi:hypothetical protein
MMVDVNEVIEFHGLRPKHLQLATDDTAKLEEMVGKWIIQAEDLIIQYTNNPSLKEDVPPSVENVCLRLVSNMINVAITRRDTPIIKVNDWTIQSAGSRIFTQDLKDDLRPFVKENSTISDTIDIFTITGGD